VEKTVNWRTSIGIAVIFAATLIAVTVPLVVRLATVYVRMSEKMPTAFVGR